MGSRVLQCPLCSKPFQVLEDQAGQAVRCPTCEQRVMVPPDLSLASAPNLPPVQTPPEKIVFDCPLCEGQFGITAEMFGQQVACPHCQAPVKIQTPASAPQVSSQPTTSAPAAPPSIKPDPKQPPIINPDVAADEAEHSSALAGISQIVVNPEASSTHKADEEESEMSDRVADSISTAFVPKNIDRLLPPRFDVIDPEQLALRSRRSKDHQVILPDGKGGLTKVDDRFVKVKLGDEEFNLIALAPHQLRRRRQIQNAVFMVGGAIMLAIIFALLRKSV